VYLVPQLRVKASLVAQCFVVGDQNVNVGIQLYR
jgi:hypothetical protein